MTSFGSSVTEYMQTAIFTFAVKKQSLTDSATTISGDGK